MITWIVEHPIAILFGCILLGMTWYDVWEHGFAHFLKLIGLIALAIGVLSVMYSIGS